MDPHTQQWLSLGLRWLHIIAGIAWIGSSFYFNWLDGNLRPPEKPRQGVAGELWSVHGGGFYVVQKYQVAPDELPKTLHWFKWEAYTTWLSGFALLVLVYYMSGPAYLLDAQSPLGFPAAVAVGLSALGGGWLIYDLLCDSPLGRSPIAFAAVGFPLATAAAWGLSELFGSRAAYIHVGAMLGTIMAANVFFVIIPSQRELVDAKHEGREPDPSKGARAKLRSLHNNYITLPVLFIMISNHYPVTFEHRYNWAVLAALALASAGIRHWFNLRNKGYQNHWILPAAALVMLSLVFVTAPRASVSGEGPPVAFAQVWTVMSQRCGSCHSAHPTDDVFTVAPNGVVFDTPQQITGYLQQIKARAVDTHSMPLANKTGMTEEERALIGRWIAQGAPTDGDVRPPAPPPPAPAAEPAAAEPDKSPERMAREYFEKKCVVCHGKSGAGDGPGAGSLEPKPRRFADSGWQAAVTDAELARVIVDGGAAVGKSTAMPPNPDLKKRPALVDELVRLVRKFGS
jgi:uncharacterized membrane protein